MYIAYPVFPVLGHVSPQSQDRREKDGRKARSGTNLNTLDIKVERYQMISETGGAMHRTEHLLEICRR